MGVGRLPGTALLVAALTLVFLLPAAPSAAQSGPLWVAIDAGPVGDDGAVAIALNPLNRSVNVTGVVSQLEPRPGHFSGFDYGSVAYRDRDGARLSRAAYNGPGTGAPGDEDNYDIAGDIAADPASGRVYVTGTSQGTGTGLDYATVAYGRAGTRLWVARYSPLTADNVTAMAVDPASGNVYVTGYSIGSSTTQFATVAYRRDGVQLWAARYNAGGNQSNFANAIAVDSRSGNVYVTGSANFDSEDRIATVAYSAAGNLLWTSLYDTDGNDRPNAIAVDPGRGTVYVTGFSSGSPSNAADFTTIAYGPGGTQVWAATYDDPLGRTAVAVGLAVHPATGNVYVTGEAEVTFTLDSAVVTIGYARTGAAIWTAEYAAPDSLTNEAVGIAVDERTGNPHVVGNSVYFSDNQTIATIAYSPAGQQLRADIYDSAVSDIARAMTLDSRMGLLYITGYTQTASAETDYLTLAYPAAGR